MILYTKGAFLGTLKYDLFKKNFDSYGWLEWFTDGKLADAYQRYISNQDSLLVPAITLYEVSSVYIPVVIKSFMSLSRSPMVRS
jgi:hypothetical protein